MNHQAIQILSYVVIILVWIFAYAIIVEVMRPWRLQKAREIKCDHAFQKYDHTHPGRAVFITMFCPKCGCSKVIASGDHVGVVEKPVAKSAVRQKGLKMHKKTQREWTP